MTEQLKIVAAAICKEDGLVFSVPRPGRHHDVIHAAAKAGMPTPIRGEQGFLASDGRFYSRDMAAQIAESAGQLLQKTGPVSILFSEDVW